MQGRTGDTTAEIILKPGELNTPRRWHVAAPVNAEISTFPPLYRAEHVTEKGLLSLGSLLLHTFAYCLPRALIEPKDRHGEHAIGYRNMDHGELDGGR